MKKADLKKFIAVILAFTMLFATTACDTLDNFVSTFIDKPEEVEGYKIGVMEPRTGSDANAAADEIAGIELAHEVIPELNGIPVELVYADNASSVELCDDAAKSLIDAGVSVILGSYKSIYTLAASDTIKDAHVPAIAITNTNPIVTQTNPYYFRVCYIDSFEGNVTARFMIENLQVSSAAVFYNEGNDYASAMATEFISAFESISGEDDLVQKVSFPQDTAEFASYFEKLEELSPSAIFFPSTITVAQPIIQAAREQGHNFTWIGTSNWNGLEEEGVYYTLDFDPTKPITERATTFKRAYKEKYSTNDEPSDAMALGYDAYLLALRGILDSNGGTGYEIKSALEKVEDMECATGYLTMSSSGDPIKEVIVENYKNGSRSVVYTVVPEKEGRTEEVEGEQTK